MGYAALTHPTEVLYLIAPSYLVRLIYQNLPPAPDTERLALSGAERSRWRSRPERASAASCPLPFFCDSD
jgi:hypothetical protein